MLCYAATTYKEMKQFVRWNQNVNVCTELDLDPILTQPGPGPKLNSNLLLGEILQRHDADFWFNIWYLSLQYLIFDISGQIVGVKMGWQVRDAAVQPGLSWWSSFPMRWMFWRLPSVRLRTLWTKLLLLRHLILIEGYEWWIVNIVFRQTYVDTLTESGGSGAKRL